MLIALAIKASWRPLGVTLHRSRHLETQRQESTWFLGKAVLLFFGRQRKDSAHIELNFPFLIREIFQLVFYLDLKENFLEFPPSCQSSFVLSLKLRKSCFFMKKHRLKAKESHVWWASWNSSLGGHIVKSSISSDSWTLWGRASFKRGASFTVWSVAFPLPQIFTSLVVLPTWSEVCIKG